MTDLDKRMFDALQRIADLKPDTDRPKSYNDHAIIAAVRIAEAAITRALLDDENRRATQETQNDRA